jgi:Ca2+/Na+ antiporter
MIVLILMSFLVMLLVFRKKELGRAGGALMLLVYTAYVIFAAIR